MTVGPLVSIRDLTVRFHVSGAEKPSLRRFALSLLTLRLINSYAQPAPVVEALSGISFDIHQGDKIGLIGRNGAGKSTLLRALAGIYPPAGGSVAWNGRITTLFDIFNLYDDATGYENINLVASINGMSPREAEPLVRDMAEFTELGEHLNLPVRVYSSGQRLRLAFALSTFLPAEIVLIDEVIGVGDATFAKKSQKRLDHMMSGTKALVVASHSDAVLKEICNKGLYLNQGKIQFFGDIDEAIEKYYETVSV